MEGGRRVRGRCRGAGTGCPRDHREPGGRRNGARDGSRHAGRRDGRRRASGEGPGSPRIHGVARGRWLGEDVPLGLGGRDPGSPRRSDARRRCPRRSGRQERPRGRPAGPRQHERCGHRPSTRGSRRKGRHRGRRRSRRPPAVRPLELQRGAGSRRSCPGRGARGLGGSEASKAGWDLVALPPVLGLRRTREARTAMDAALGRPWFELLSPPPSVPGHEALQFLP